MVNDLHTIKMATKLVRALPKGDITHEYKMGKLTVSDIY